jgi:sec-independent protein translocase protein TatA
MTTALILGILGGLGAPEIIIILVIVLLMFGGKKIPELMKGLGRGVKDFKEASKGENGEVTTTTNTTVTNPPSEHDKK